MSITKSLPTTGSEGLRLLEDGGSIASVSWCCTDAKKNPCASLAKVFEETQTPDQLTEKEVEMPAFQEAITQLMLLSSNNYHSNSYLWGSFFLNHQMLWTKLWYERLTDTSKLKCEKELHINLIPDE